MYVWHSCLGQFHLNYLFTLVIFFFYTICMHYAYIQTTFAFYYSFSFFESVVLYVHTGIITITVSQRRRYFSLEFTLLQLLVVMMLVVYVTYMHIYGAVIVVARWKIAQYILFFPSFFLFFLIHKSSLNKSTDRVYKCVLGKILVRNKHSVRQCTSNDIE